MSKGFERTKGPVRVSVAQKFVADEGGTLAVSFPGWHHAISVYAHAADGSMAIGEANAELVADAFNTLDQTGLTPRQLAEQRAELLEMLDQLCTCPQSVDQATIPAAGVDAAPDQVIVALSVSLTQLREARAAIANATQQRNATGGEG